MGADIMKTATRFILERIAALDRAIRASEVPNAGTLAGWRSARGPFSATSSSSATGSAPLVFDNRRNGYAYSDPG